MIKEDEREGDDKEAVAVKEEYDKVVVEGNIFSNVVSEPSIIILLGKTGVGTAVLPFADLDLRVFPVLHVLSARSGTVVC